ncbi:MAG TPA: AAA family ATPase, partial [Fibrobacteria bacterium]|nr:AAA family ATPase [Fibrobacteria bacterium]
MTDSVNPNSLETASALRHEIGKAVVGQTEVVDHVLASLLAGGHVLLEGVPGLGKTLLVRALAKAFGGEFSRIQFTPDLMPADVSGHAIFDPRTQSFSTRKGPVFANLIL